MTRLTVLYTLLWIAAPALPVVACSDDAGPASVPRGKTSFGGSYAGPVTGPGSDASLPSPADGGAVDPDASKAPKVDCTKGSWDCTCEPDSVASCPCDSGASGVMTCRPSGAGYGSCQCGVGPNDKLGSACATDADCGDGLSCVTADSTAIAGQGPAGGLCTKACADDATVCAKIKTGAKCIGFPDQASSTRFCMEKCDFGDPGTAKANKCHGRIDMGCSAIIIPGVGQAAVACLPNCNSDLDCGGGLFCDPGSGLCTTTQPQGDPVGTSCSLTNDTCRGFCETLDLPVSGGKTTLCVERCTTSAIAESKTSCGWNKAMATAAPATCIYYPGANPSPGFGDRGACGQLCDCNADCKATGLVCQPLPAGLDTLFKRKGQCSAPFKVDGGTSPGIPICN